MLHDIPRESGLSIAPCWDAAVTLSCLIIIRWWHKFDFTVLQPRCLDRKQTNIRSRPQSKRATKWEGRSSVSVNIDEGNSILRSF